MRLRSMKVRKFYEDNDIRTRYYRDNLWSIAYKFNVFDDKETI